MSWKRTILAGACFVLAIMLYMADRTVAQRRIVQAVSEASLTPGINMSEVTEIELRNAGGTARLVRGNEGWMIRAPFTAAADPEVVQQLLVNVTAARKRNEIEAKNLAEYGLATPEITVKIQTNSGKSVAINLGHESTYTGQVFAAYPESRTIFTVGEQVRSVLKREPLELRVARLLDVDTGALEAYREIIVEQRGVRSRIVKLGETWQIAEPIEAPAETSIVLDYLRKLGLARASDFIDTDTTSPVTLSTALQALTSPTLTVTLQGAAAQSVVVAELDVPGRPVFVAQRNGTGQVLVLRPETLGAIAADYNALRSRTIFSLKPEDVRVFTVEIGRGRTDLVRGDDNNWNFVADPGRKVDQEQVEVRLDSLLRTRVKQYVEATPTDYSIFDLGNPPRFRFTVQSRDRERTEILEAGRSEPNQVSSVYAKRASDPAVFTIDLSREIIISDDLVAEKRFLRTSIELVSLIEIGIDGSTFTLRQKERVWELKRPGQETFGPANGPRAERIFGGLNSLEYDRDYTAEGETVISSPEPGGLKLRILGPDGNELAGMEVQRRMPQSSLIIGFGGRLYEVPNAELDLLEAAIRSLIQ